MIRGLASANLSPAGVDWGGVSITTKSNMSTFATDLRALVLPAVFGAIGFTPIGALCLTIFGLWSLSLGTLILIVPAIGAAITLGLIFPVYGRFALEGLAAGLVAVLVYDLVRWTFVVFGLWGDFIPNIGGWLNGTGQPDVILGYGFRWLGDGGGMGVAFMVAARVLLPRLSTRASVTLGISYGLAIWLCLLVTLIVAPLGETLLFPLTPVTLVLSCIGHIVYGAVLGYALARISIRPGPAYLANRCVGTQATS